MLFRATVALALAAQASAYYIFPTPYRGLEPEHADGQSPFSVWPGPDTRPTKATPFLPPHAQELVKPLLAKIANVSAERMHDDLEGLTSFLTRHAPTKVRNRKIVVI
jgi:hypothetical protein